MKTLRRPFICCIPGASMSLRVLKPLLAKKTRRKFVSLYKLCVKRSAISEIRHGQEQSPDAQKEQPCSPQLQAVEDFACVRKERSRFRANPRPFWPLRRMLRPRNPYGGAPGTRTRVLESLSRPRVSATFSRTPDNLCRTSHSTVFRAPSYAEAWRSKDLSQARGSSAHRRPQNQ